MLRWEKHLGAGHRSETADDLSGDEARHSAGALPAKLSVRLRVTVTAGLAKLVDEVNE